MNERDQKIWQDILDGKGLPPIEVEERGSPNAIRKAAGLPPINSHVGNRDLQEIASELHKLNNNIGMLIKAVKARK